MNKPHRLAPTANNTGAAVVVFPGGAYKILAVDFEGTEVCDWLNSAGITCLLLKYRVPDTGPYPKSARLEVVLFRTRSEPSALRANMPLSGTSIPTESAFSDSPRARILLRRSARITISVSMTPSMLPTSSVAALISPSLSIPAISPSPSRA